MFYKDKRGTEFIAVSGYIVKVKTDGSDTIMVPHVINKKVIKGVCPQAFSGCKAEKLIFEEGITVIPPAAFDDSSFTEVVWPSSANILLPDTFYGMKSLKKITIPDNVRVMENAFSCSGIEEIVWPANCPEIPTNCFCNCKQLKSITGLEAVSVIKDSAFMDSSVEFIDAPNLRYIGAKAFMGSAIQAINADDFMFVGEAAFACTKQLKHFEWSEFCNVIPSRCFEMSAIREISNIDEVTDIMDRAFRCSLIEKFECPENVDSIPADCFEDCNKLTRKNQDDLQIL